MFIVEEFGGEQIAILVTALVQGKYPVKISNCLAGLLLAPKIWNAFSGA